MPLKRYGIADEAVALEDVGAALERCLQLPRNRPKNLQNNATANVVEVIRGFL